MRTVAMTGHRPEKIQDKEAVLQAIADGLTYEIQPTQVIQGMAAGVDLWSAQVAFNLGIPYICAKPFTGHKPRKDDVEDYEKALKNAIQIVNVTDYLYYPGGWVYQRRNEWMVDNADVVFAIWDESPGGTANCAKYAYKLQKPIFHYNPATGKSGWVDYLPDDYG